MDGRQAVDRFQVTACAAAGRPWALDSQQQSHPQQQQQPELLPGSRGAVEEIIAIFPSRHLPSSSSDAGPTTSERDFLGFLSLREIEVGTAHALPGIGLMTCPLACLLAAKGSALGNPKRMEERVKLGFLAFNSQEKKLFCCSTNVDI